MNYAWLLPPMCDPEDGHLLMDGCYINNVPGDVMGDNDCKHILAVDVVALDDRDLTDYGDSLNGFWLLWKKFAAAFFWGSKAAKIPDLSEIQMRLAFCSHYKNLEELKSNPNYEYIHPPMEKYLAADFHLFEEIRAVGYHHGSTFFSGLRRAQQHRRMSEGGSGHKLWFPTSNCYSEWSKNHHKHQHERRNSGNYTITDLAQIVFGQKKQQLQRSSNSPSPVEMRSRSNSSQQQQRKRRMIPRRGPRYYGLVAQPLDSDEYEADGSDDTGIVL